jgi:hypothetical protein
MNKTHKEKSMKKVLAQSVSRALIFAIALIAPGLTVAPQATAQTQDQAQVKKRMTELKAEMDKLHTQIAARGGKPTAEEMERVRSMSLEVLTLQGIPPDQARQMMEGAQQRAQNPNAAADRERQAAQIQRQVEQSQQVMQQQQQAQQEQDRQRQEAAAYLGKNRGWPGAAALKECGGEKALVLKQPAGTTASYNYEGNRLEVYLSGGKTDAVMLDLVRQIEAAAGKKAQQNSDGSYSVELRPSGASINENYPIYITRKRENGVVELIIYTPVG